MNRWTGRNRWIPRGSRPPVRWYPYARTVTGTPGAYFRERRRWWVLVVVFRIFKQAYRR